MAKKIAVVLLALFLFLTQPGLIFAKDAGIKFLVAASPVADIRKEPRDRKIGRDHDGLQETQVLFNEVLLYRFSKADWYCVEAVEQREFTHNNKWQGYPGYIRKEKARFVNRLPEYDSVVAVNSARILDSPSLSARVLFNVFLGTKFKIAGTKRDFYKVGIGDRRYGWISKKDIRRIRAGRKEEGIRKDLVETARLFLKIPYLWGGRDPARGVDCSGFTNLAYRANGIDIPRDAQEQWMAAKRINSGQLKPGDLIFLSGKKKKGKNSIVHVMLFIGGEDFIEAPGTGKEVRVSSFKDKFGMSLRSLKKKNFIARARKIYFGKVGMPE